jgi:tetratricopeptide (TPR) repeat protein
MAKRPSPQGVVDAGSGNGLVFGVPYPRNPNFTGRERLLDSMHQSLTSDNPSARVQAVYGMGGVGKSQLALEYAYRHRDDYAIIWWVPSDDPATASLHLSKLAARLGMRMSSGGLTPEDVRAALHQELKGRSDWLIIFDNAPDPDAIAALLPERSGAVIITSRNPDWGSLAQSFCLRVLERADSIQFLQKRTGLSNADGAAGKLAQAVGDLPLALEQAAATVEQARITFADYLGRFENHWAELLRSGRTPGDYPDTVAMTWELAFREVTRDAPVAAALLNLCAFLAPVDIPRSFLTRAATALPRPLSSTVADPLQLDNVIARLHRYSLVDVTEKTLAIHKLVAAVARDRLTQQQHDNWCDVALRMVEGTFVFNENSTEGWGHCAAILPHALTVARHAETAGISPEVVAKLLNQVGLYLHQIARYREARGVLERALTQHERAFGESNPRRSAIVNNLGRVLRRLGHLEEARAHFEAALVVDQASYGESHAHVAEIVNNYGNCLHIAGEIEQAREQFEWALAVCEMHYGAEHPKVATVINNLGYAHAGLGDADRAVEHLQRALTMAEATYGPNHPTLASIRTNLGLALRLRGEDEQARQQFERAIQIGESALGPNHPDVARGLTYLGLLLHDRGQLPAARQLLERAMGIDERVLGPSHISLITRLNYLGRCLKKMGDVDEASRCYERAAGILRHLRENSQPAQLGEAAAKQAAARSEVFAAPAM